MTSALFGFLIALLMVWSIRQRRDHNALRKAFDKFVVSEQAAEERKKKWENRDILVRYDRNMFGEDATKYISYGQGINLIREHLGLVFEHVDKEPAYTKLSPKPEPEEKEEE